MTEPDGILSGLRTQGELSDLLLEDAGVVLTQGGEPTFVPEETSVMPRTKKTLRFPGGLLNDGFLDGNQPSEDSSLDAFLGAAFFLGFSSPSGLSALGAAAFLAFAGLAAAASSSVDFTSGAKSTHSR